MDSEAELGDILGHTVGELVDRDATRREAVLQDLQRAGNVKVTEALIKQFGTVASAAGLRPPDQRIANLCCACRGNGVTQKRCGAGGCGCSK